MNRFSEIVFYSPLAWSNVFTFSDCATYFSPLKDLKHGTVCFILIKFKGIIFCDCGVLSAVARELWITHSIDKRQETIYAILGSVELETSSCLECLIKPRLTSSLLCEAFHILIFVRIDQKESCPIYLWACAPMWPQCVSWIESGERSETRENWSSRYPSLLVSGYKCTPAGFPGWNAPWIQVKVCQIRHGRMIFKAPKKYHIFNVHLYKISIK